MDLLPHGFRLVGRHDELHGIHQSHQTAHTHLRQPLPVDLSAVDTAQITHFGQTTFHTSQILQDDTCNIDTDTPAKLK